MKIVNADECLGVQISSPYQRRIKVLMAPDYDVQEATMSQVTLLPQGQTDYHVHDRCEFIYIISGKAELKLESETLSLQPDTALYISPDEKHKLVNTSNEPVKMITFFVPPFTAKELYEACLRREKHTSV